MPTVTHAPRKRARKIKGALGPFQSACSIFDSGRKRMVEIESITASCIWLRLKGLKERFCLPLGTAYEKAVSIQTRFDTAPRTISPTQQREINRANRSPRNADQVYRDLFDGRPKHFEAMSAGPDPSNAQYPEPFDQQ